MPTFENIPEILSKRNRYKLYTPTDKPDPLSYSKESVNNTVFHSIFGPTVVKDPTDLQILPPDKSQLFDLLGEYSDFNVSSPRGKRRDHAFTLMAIYANRPVILLEHMLDKQAKSSYKDTLNILKALSIGSKWTFISSPDRVMYTTDRELMNTLGEQMLNIRLRTAEITEIDLDRLPTIPQFGGDKINHLSFLSTNDWEIVAGTYRSEVEAYLKVMLLLGYDFLPPNSSVDENGVPEDEEITDYVPFTPGKVFDPEVTALLGTLRRRSPSLDSIRALSTPTRRRSPMPVNPSSVSLPPSPEDFKAEGAKPHSVSFELPNLSGHDFGSWEVSGSSHPSFPSSIPRRPVPAHIPSIPSPEIGRTAVTSARSIATTVPSVIPSYQIDQMDRIYGKPIPEVPRPVTSMVSERLADLFKPSPFNTEEQGDIDIQLNPGPSRSVAVSTLREPLPETSQPVHPNRARFANPFTMSEENQPNDQLQSNIRPDSSLDPTLGLPASWSSTRADQGSHHAPSINSPTSYRGSNDPPDGGRWPPRGPPSGGGYPPSGPPGIPPNGGSGPPGQPPSGGPGSGPSNGSDPSDPDDDPPVSDPDNNPGQPPDPNPPGGNGWPFPNGPPGGPPGGPPNGGGGGGPPIGGNPGSGNNSGPGNNPPGRSPLIMSAHNKWINTNETHFDTKLKPDIIPTWNGNEELLGKWIVRINEIAQRSVSVWKGLGDIAPSRFVDSAASWWYSLPEDHRAAVTLNWDTLRKEIRTFWMTQAFIDKAQRKALAAKYRDKGHELETPSDYYIRKHELISLAYDFSVTQTMAEVLRGAPVMWSTILNTSYYTTLANFQNAIKYHEDILIKLTDNFEPRRSNPKPTFNRNNPFRQKSFKVETRSPRNPFRKKPPNQPAQKAVKSFAVGWSPGRAPEFPRDDSNVSKGRTPESYGARGCIFCGSKKHWDKECSHAKGNMRKAKTAYAEYSAEALHAEAEYEDAYQDKDNDEFQEYDPWEDNEVMESNSEDSEDVTDEADF